MKLHLDREAFLVLMNDIHEKSGYRMDVLEKDYYVVLILEELKKMQEDGLPAYFKGGTALYKALKTTNRFSEDIDLSVDTRECSRTQNDKRLERATKKYEALPRDCEQGKTNRSEVVTVYDYEPLAVYDRNDALQRFGKLKVEATSFTISEPVQPLEVSAMLYDLASDNQKQLLHDVYDVKPFSVMTITLERIFIDKLFAAEAYMRNIEKDHRAFEAAKHIYDLAVMSDQPQIQCLMQDEPQMRQLLDIRMEEEKTRLDGIPGIQPQEFVFFAQAKDCSRLIEAYETMQNQYVLRDRDRISFEQALSALGVIQAQLMGNRAWEQYRHQSIRAEKPNILQELAQAKAEIKRQDRERLNSGTGAPTASKHRKDYSDWER